MLLSVLSAWLRLGVDPWLEAAHLTHMPEETATVENGFIDRGAARQAIGATGLRIGRRPIDRAFAARQCDQQGFARSTSSTALRRPSPKPSSS